MTKIFGRLLLLMALSASGFARSPWIKLTTSDVVVYSDASERTTINFVVGYAAFRHAFREVIHPPRVAPPAIVVLFDTSREMYRYLPDDRKVGYHTVSYSTTIGSQALLAINGEDAIDDVLENTAVFDSMWELEQCGYVLPTWMSQGAGEVLSSADVKRAVTVVGDGPAVYEQKWREQTPFGWSRFFSITRSSPEYAGSKADGMFHAQAWALVHWILLGEKGPERFSELARNLRHMGALEAVESVVGLPPDKWRREIDHNLNQRSAWREISFDRDAFRKTLTTVPASEADVHAQIANLMFSAGRKVEAEGELARAQVLAPESVVVEEAEAYNELRNGDPDHAAQLYRRAIAHGSTNAEAYLRSAGQRLDDQTEGRDRAGQGGPEIDTAITELRKALTLNPGSRDGYRLLGRAFFLASTVTPENVTELEPGLTADEAGARVRYYRALLWSRLDRPDDAVAELQRALTDSADDARLHGLVEEHLEKAQFAKLVAAVEPRVKKRDFAGARAVVQQAMAADSDGQHQAEFQHLLDWIDQNDRFRALEVLHAKGPREEFETAAKSFLHDFPRSPVSAKLQAMLDDAGDAASGAAQ
jgi:tetratricopeptide (TPR) repeat protein